MSKIEEKIIDFIVKYFDIVMVVMGCVMGMWVRLQGLPKMSLDYQEFLEPWFEMLKTNGGFKGLSMNFYSYYIPYMCILAFATYFEGINLLLYIKAISIVSEYMCALFALLLCRNLLRNSGQEQKWSAAIVVIFLLSPMVLLNGAYWAQCDYIYGAFCLLSVWLLYREKYDLSFLFLGLAFCFKLQTVFLFPAYLLYYICNRKFSIVKFLYIPAMYLVCGIPAIIAGKPVKEVYQIYLGQTHFAGQLSLNTPNIYRFFPNMEYNDFYKFGIALTIVIFCILAFIVFHNDYKLDQQTFLMVCVCSTGICVMFLPGMHERYTVLYAAFAYIYFLVYERRKLVLACVIDLVTCVTYFYTLYGEDKLAVYPLLAVINLVILFYIIYDTLSVLKLHHQNGVSFVSIKEK